MAGNSSHIHIIITCVVHGQTFAENAVERIFWSWSNFARSAHHTAAIYSWARYLTYYVHLYCMYACRVIQYTYIVRVHGIAATGCDLIFAYTHRRKWKRSACVVYIVHGASPVAKNVSVPPNFTHRAGHASQLFHSARRVHNSKWSSLVCWMIRWRRRVVCINPGCVLVCCGWKNWYPHKNYNGKKINVSIKALAFRCQYVLWGVLCVAMFFFLKI